MNQPPELIPFNGDWPSFEEVVYQAFLETFVKQEVRFQGCRVSAPYRPATRGKHYSFWHVISEAPHPQNRVEEDRIPNIQRCERICWIAWAIQRADDEAEEFSWWENRRGRETHVVIWAEQLDFSVILAKRRDYYLLKTAYCELRSGRRRAFKRERDQFRRSPKG